MIVKKIRNQNTPKPKTKQVADLVDYIRQPHNTNPAEKIEHSGGLNFLTGTHSSQKKEMIILATETVYSKMPVSHYVFSWREHEQPTAEQVDELVDIFLREMGLEGCQTVYGLHYNTENYHVHIAVNRMHPVSMKVIDPNHGFDIEAAHKVLALVEHRQGWSSEAKARYTVNQAGDVVRRPRKNSTLSPKQPALDFECATGEKSAQRIAQERGHAIIREAKSWQELHEKLEVAGLRLEKKSSGAIIFVGEIAVKASSVDRAFSLGKLCRRLGEFVPGNYSVDLPAPDPEPVSFINLKQWKQYRAERSRQASSAASMPEESPEIGLLKDLHRKDRATLHERLSGHPRCILNIARHALKLQQREEMRLLLLRKTKKPVRSRRRRFEDWLWDRDMHRQADRWRYRKALESLPEEFRGAPTVMATPTREPLASYTAHKRAMLKAVPDTEPDRLNAYIALQMRKEGFSREAVTEIILECAPQDRPGQPERNWRRYAVRMAACAFGIEGDLRLARGSTAKKKQQGEHEQEKLEEQAQPEEAPRVEEKQGTAPRQALRMR
ncbi:MAG: relaxase/mobilization nuclease domain-containing protein [Desulfovibrio sp.]|jgi:hypothetical protein|nr:relaxase/mobilization nuclease domain-containing protein [Desulfovibrio sp.]